MNQKNPRQNFNKKPPVVKHPRPVYKTLSISIPKDANGVELYDASSLYALLEHLSDQDVFSYLSVMADINRKYLTEGGKGVIRAARIAGYDKDAKTMDVVFFGRNIETGELIDNRWEIIPKALSNRNDNTVYTIIGFEIAPAVVM